MLPQAVLYHFFHVSRQLLWHNAWDNEAPSDRFALKDLISKCQEQMGKISTGVSDNKNLNFNSGAKDTAILRVLIFN
jgi:hypothetical protein